MCLQVTVERGEGRKPLVARFGGIPLKRQEKAVIVDRIPELVTYPRKELPMRLRRGNARSRPPEFWTRRATTCGNVIDAFAVAC